MLPRISTEATSVPPTFGSATSRPRENGYCIAFADPLAAALASEHTAVVRTVGGAGPLGMLICFVVDEREPAARADGLLKESGLTGARCAAEVTACESGCCAALGTRVLRLDLCSASGSASNARSRERASAASPLMANGRRETFSACRTGIFLRSQPRGQPRFSMRSSGCPRRSTKKLASARTYSMQRWIEFTFPDPQAQVPASSWRASSPVLHL